MRDYFYIPNVPSISSRIAASTGRNLNDLKHFDLYYYLMDSIFVGEVVCKRADPDRFVPVNSKILERILTTKHASSVKKTLLKIGILEEKCPKGGGKPYYQSGICSKSYRFTNLYRKAGFTHKTVTNTKLLSRIGKFQSREHAKNIVPNLGRSLIHHSVEQADFDFEAARHLINQTIELAKKQKEVGLVIADAFESNSYWHSTRPGERYYHLFTSCPRYLRRFTSWNGQELYSVDVSNCQPALHATLYEGESPEKSKYVELVSTGGFYQFLNGLLKKPFDLKTPREKQKLKEAVFCRIFYGTPNPKRNYKITTAFRECFPTLHELIRSKKRDNLRDLPVSLQNMEAEIVLDDAACKIANRYPSNEICLISIHDSLVTTKERIDEVQFELAEAFKRRLGFSVKTNVSAFSES